MQAGLVVVGTIECAGVGAEDGQVGELGAVDTPTITVLTKLDRVSEPERLAELRHLYPDALNISAFTGLGMEALLQKCSEVMADRVRLRRYRIPQSRADLLGMLHRDAKVLSTEYEENDILVTAVVPAAIDGRLDQFSC